MISLFSKPTPSPILGRSMLLIKWICCLVVPTSALSSLGQQPLYQSKEYTVWKDHVISGTTSAQVISPAEIDVTATSTKDGAQAKRWALQDDISAYPQMRSDIPLVDALYNMSLGELKKNTRPDGAFNAGANWNGVWTRDVSYSMLLSLAAIQPDASKASLLQKVNRRRIVQDTGTGGSWPVSSDRVTWALGAWEVYLVNGDKLWLRQAFEIIQNTVKDDEKVVIDPSTGLARGETTFLDWREQTYPRWMEPVDIYESKTLGTNAVYFRTYTILSAMATELGEPPNEYAEKAEKIRQAMNRLLWIEEKGTYGQYLYGRVWQSVSPRYDALAESLCILFDVADARKQDRILSSQPLLNYGIPTVFPDSQGIPPYHNRTVWPFVQAFWNLAAAKRGDGEMLTYGLGSIFRQAAVFLTNKENFMSDTGLADGPVLNSDRQLWSVAGNLAMTYRVFFGMDFATDGLHLQPVVPDAYRGVRVLTNFHYRDAILSIEVRGSGNNIRAITMDGERAAPFVPASTTGSHRVVIQLDNQPLKSNKINISASSFAPDTPQLKLEDKTILWKPIKGASTYRVYRNGSLLTDVSGTTFAIPNDGQFAEYQVEALNTSKGSSFLSAPVAVTTKTLTIPLTSATEPYVSLDQKERSGLLISWDVPARANYVVVFHYANGNGPINTDNKCALRTLFVDGKEIGPVVMPQRGLNVWKDWGWTNESILELTQGQHVFELRLQNQDVNMNVETNSAQVDLLVLTPK